MTQTNHASTTSAINLTHHATSDQSGPPVALSREQILETTFSCLRQSGYEATTIRQIASCLNCAVGSIYRYFRDKHHLLNAVAQELLSPVQEGIKANIPLDRSVTMYIRLATADLQTYQLMFWLACRKQTAVMQTPPLPEVVCEILDGWTQKLKDPTTARTLWAMVHGLVLLNQDHATIEKQIDHLLHRHHHGIKATENATPGNRPESPLHPQIEIVAQTPGQPVSVVEDITLL